MPWDFEWFWVSQQITYYFTKIVSCFTLVLCLAVVVIQGMSIAPQLWVAVQWLSCLFFAGFLAVLVFLYLVVKNGSKEGSISIGYKSFFVKATCSPAPEEVAETARAACVILEALRNTDQRDRLLPENRPAPAQAVEGNPPARPLLVKAPPARGPPNRQNPPRAGGAAGLHRNRALSG